MIENEYLEMPWRIEDTIENLKAIKEHLIATVLKANLDGKGKQDAKGVEFDFNRAIQALEEIQQYRAIGTIGEFKDLKEKNEPYKPQEYEDRYYACKCDNILLLKWRKYPTELMPKSEGLPHCMACGQKLDWQ